MKKIVIIFLCLYLAGCATLQSVKELKGHGVIKAYNVPIDMAGQAAIEVLHDLKFVIQEGSIQQGYLIGTTRLSGWSWGELVGVYFNKLNDYKSNVEVISKRKMATNIMAKDWTEIIFEKLDLKLLHP